MGHKTLIGGTAYEISGGKTLVNGTAYSIDKGKTLVGGTAYEVGFGKDVTITFVEPAVRQYNSEIARVTIDGVVYDGSSFDSIAVKAGTIIECYILVENTTTAGAIKVDGEYKVKNQTGTYNHTVESDCTIACNAMSITIFGSTQKSGVIQITTVG